MTASCGGGRSIRWRSCAREWGEPRPAIHCGSHPTGHCMICAAAHRIDGRLFWRGDLNLLVFSMDLKEMLDGVSCLSVRSAFLALRNPSKFKRYVSHCLRTYDELSGNGLPGRNPVDPSEEMTITIPAHHSGGGMSFGELVYLSRTVRVLKPATIFEMGSYNGLTTAAFIL